MPTVTANTRRWLPWPIPVGLCVVFAGGGLLWQRGSGDSTIPPSVPSTTLLEVSADSIYQFDGLDEMVAASDLIVTGEVVSTVRGRLVGDPAAGGVISRIVTVRVDDVLLGGDAATEQILVEEEGWLPDGTPIVVSGVAASQEGDIGLWFLDQLAPDDVTTYLVINSQGRFLNVDELTIGGDQSDPLVQSLQKARFDALVQLVIESIK